MNTTEIKEKINKMLDELPDSKLPDALTLMTELSEVSAKEKRSELVKQIIKEDEEVFKRLAE